MKRTPEEIAQKMDALGMWDKLVPYNFAIKPRGTVFPYFCTVLPGEHPSVRFRFLMLEGWQTLHDFVRTRVDRNFGFYLTPSEMPHLELVLYASGEMKLFRHDIAYAPALADETQRALAARLLWEAYGVMLRMETEPKLLMKYADEKGLFARVETAPEQWTDQPLQIPEPPPHIETISFPKNDIKQAKDLPILKDETLEIDFDFVPNVATKEPRPRSVYCLRVFDPKVGKFILNGRISANPESGLRGLWEPMPSVLLKFLIKCGKIPGSIRTRSGRVFRMLRPLGMELSFKLSLHDRLSFD